MVDADGAAQVSKAMPVNAAPAILGEALAAGEAGCGAAGALPPGVVAAGNEVAASEDTVGAVVVEPDDLTAEARTRSIDETSAPHVACRSTPWATSRACLSWPTESTLTRAARTPTIASWEVNRSICPAEAGFSQTVSARPTACAGQSECGPGDPR